MVNLRQEMLVCALLFAAARTGTVKIHLTNSRGKPIPNHEVWLAETNSTKPVRPFGVQWFVPGGPYHGTTGISGDVAIHGVPLRKSMMVITKFGPRFDPFVGKDNPSGASLDVMKFDGAVYAGKTAHVVLDEDREVSGTVTDDAGRPLNGIPVTLSDTGFGHMSGYPGTTLDRQITDDHGVYHFTRLPNCDFLIFAGVAPHMAVESRTDRSHWHFIAIVGQDETSESVLADKPKSECDFRIYQTAKLTVTFKGTPAQLKGWTAYVATGSVTEGGRDLGYDPTSSTFDCYALPGVVTISLTRERGEKILIAKKLTLKPGESRAVEISMADVLKRKSRS